MSRERPTPYGTEESLALENARLRGALRQERRRARELATRLEEAERRAEARADESRRRQYLEDRDRLLAGILDAWEDPGPMPNVHRRAQRDVRHMMPVLVRRLEHVLRRRPTVLQYEYIPGETRD